MYRMTLTCNDTSGLIHFLKVAKKRTLSIELTQNPTYKDKDRHWKRDKVRVKWIETHLSAVGSEWVAALWEQKQEDCVAEELVSFFLSSVYADPLMDWMVKWKCWDFISVCDSVHFEFRPGDHLHAIWKLDQGHFFFYVVFQLCGFKGISNAPYVVFLFLFWEMLPPYYSAHISFWETEC